MSHDFHEYIEGTKKVGIAFQHNYMKDVMNNGFQDGKGGRLCFTNQDNITFFMQSRTQGYQVDVPSQAAIMRQIDEITEGLDVIFIPDGVEDDILELAQEFKELLPAVPITVLASSASCLLTESPSLLKNKPSEELKQLIELGLVSVGIKHDHTLSLSETFHVSRQPNAEDIRHAIKDVLESGEKLELHPAIESILPVSGFDAYRPAIKTYLGLPLHEELATFSISPENILEAYPGLRYVED